MKTLVVDDNPIARTTLKELARQLKVLEWVGECSTALAASEIIHSYPVDLVLLDIEMPGMSGIELVKNLTIEKPLFIFTTAKKDYALDAFDLNVIDYLVKPILPERFNQAIQKAQDALLHKHEEINVGQEEFLFVRDTNIIRRLKFDEILFIEAMGDYVKFHVKDKFYAIHTTLKTVEDRLPLQAFARVHRSYIVAIDKIDIIQEGTIIINKKLIPVADSYRAAFNKRINVL
ncbi:MAG: LytTR family DNA-binding domain-containing protein [Saprospiraceae bacterium]